MKRKFQIFLLCMLLCGGQSLIYAAEDLKTPFLQKETQDDHHWQGDLNDIKASTEELIDENQRLSLENSTLNSDLVQAEAAIEKSDQEKTTNMEKLKETRGYMNEQKEKIKALQDEIDGLNKD